MQYKLIKDIEYFDGPLLSLRVNSESDKLYLFSWCDVIHNYNVWLIFEVLLDSVNDYEDNKITLLDLINQSKDLKLAYINSCGDLILETDVTVNLLPHSYLPSEDSYFNNHTRYIGLNK